MYFGVNLTLWLTNLPAIERTSDLCNIISCTLDNLPIFCPRVKKCQGFRYTDISSSISTSRFGQKSRLVLSSNWNSFSLSFFRCNKHHFWSFKMIWHLFLGWNPQPLDYKVNDLALAPSWCYGQRNSSIKVPKISDGTLFSFTAL